MLYFPVTRRMTGINLFSIWSAITKSAINVVSGKALLVLYVMRVLTDSAKMSRDSFVHTFFNILVIATNVTSTKLL
jgi:hypothetical protein